MRYKEYNVNRVLEHCIKLFWDKGFKGCAINDIVNETGVNRFSLYHEFKDKDGILYASLELYRERYCEEKFNILRSQGQSSELIKDFYLSFLQESNVSLGCYFIHVGTELADSDEKIKFLVREYLAEIELLFVDLLKRNGLNSTPAAPLAKQLVGLFCTSMSFCLIHTDEQRKKHIETGINLILNNHG